MKPIKQIFNDMLAWWENFLKDQKSRTTLIWIIIFIVAVAVYLALVIPSSAVEEPIPYVTHEGGSTPTDLTGYTVTVPAGWTASAGYGKFNITGSGGWQGAIIQMQGFGIGINKNWESFTNQCSVSTRFPSPTVSQVSFIENSKTIVLKITGGTDSSNSSLIQWLVDNNATFTPPEPEGVTVPAGIYYMQNIYNDTRGTLTFDRPFISGDSLYYNSIDFEGYQDNQYTEVIYTYTQVIPDGSSGPPAPPFELSVYNGVDGFENIANCIILIQVDEILTEEEATLFNQVFIPVNSDNKLINLYNGALENGKNFGYNTGFDSGYQEGFQDGVENSGGSFFGNFIQGILDALDKLVILPGDISILDVIKTVGGLFVVIWLLKLLAGG